MNARELPGTETPAAGNSADLELVEVLDACLTDLLDGRAVDTERLVDEHPRIAARLRRCLAGLSLVEQQRRALTDGTP
jgi:hypothetical protein